MNSSNPSDIAQKTVNDALGSAGEKAGEWLGNEDAAKAAEGLLPDTPEVPAAETPEGLSELEGQADAMAQLSESLEDPAKLAEKLPNLPEGFTDGFESLPKMATDLPDMPKPPTLDQAAKESVMATASAAELGHLSLAENAFSESGSIDPAQAHKQVMMDTAAVSPAAKKVVAPKEMGEIEGAADASQADALEQAQAAGEDSAHPGIEEAAGQAGAEKADAPKPEDMAKNDWLDKAAKAAQDKKPS